MTPTTNAAHDTTVLIAQALERHGYDDWYVALLSAALDGTGEVGQAIALADRLYEQQPTDTAVEAADDEEWLLGPAEAADA